MAEEFQGEAQPPPPPEEEYRNSDRREERSRGKRSRDRRSRDRRSRDRRRSRDKRSRDRDRRRSRSRSRRRGGGSLQDELRADRGEEPQERMEEPPPPSEAPPPPPDEPKRKKSRWGEEDPLAAAGIPDWLRDQFSVPKLPPEPVVRAGQRKVKVPQHCVGRILGKMGATINEIQEASNTDIKMNQDTKEAGYSYAIVTSIKNVVGDLDTAERLINEKIAGGGGGGNKGGGGGMAQPLPTPAGSETREMRVEKAHVGSLIGKGGEVIRMMTSEAGCQIQIDQSQSGEGATIILGPGSAEQVQKAEDLINAKIVEKFGNKGGGPRPPMGMGRPPNSLPPLGGMCPPPPSCGGGLAGVPRPPLPLNLSPGLAGGKGCGPGPGCGGCGCGPPSCGGCGGCGCGCGGCGCGGCGCGCGGCGGCGMGGPGCSSGMGCSGMGCGGCCGPGGPGCGNPGCGGPGCGCGCQGMGGCGGCGCGCGCGCGNWGGKGGGKQWGQPGW